jgi:ABC-2 type transport system ATP-binding protein
VKHILKIEQILLRRSSQFCLDIRAIRVQGGSILCITGPNGSGKTTLIECLVGNLTKKTVTVTIDGQVVGHNIRNTKALVGYIPDDEYWFIKELCATEYFALLTSIYVKVGIPQQKLQYRVQRFAATLRFTAFDQSLESLSHGNKKKVQIIAGLMHEPALIVVDELRNGLDPFAIVAAEEIIRMEAARGACVVAATHDLWWAERIANDTMLLIGGRVVLLKPTMDLLQEFGSLEKLFMQLLKRDEPAHASV